MAVLTYPSSWVEICNQALSRISKPPLVDYADASQEGAYCRIHLPQVVEEIYGDHNWRGGRIRLELVPLPPPPPLGFAHEYPLPSDCARVIEVQTEVGLECSIENGSILTDSDTLTLIYVQRPTGEANTIPAYMRLAITTGLSLKLSTPLVKDKVLRAQLEAEYEAALETAKRADSRLAGGEDAQPWYDEAR
jgi:hypothetical protein